MRWRMTQLGTAILLAPVFLAAPTAAQNGPDSPPDSTVYFESPRLDAGGPDAGGFIALMVIAGIIGIGMSIWKFATLRDMGMRRGMSRSDATAAAFFSDDAVTSTMILKPEVDRRPRRLRRTPTRPPEPTIEERLAKVDSLRERDLITAAEAASRRDEILDEI